MTITSISTKALSEATRLMLMKAEVRLASAQKEVVTARHADVGTALGFLAGQAVSVRNDFARLGALLDTNAVADTRMATTQSVLTGLADDAQAFIAALIGARSSDTGAEVAAAEARARLNSLIAGLNTAVANEHIFAGINSGSAPLADYFGVPTPASRQSVADAIFTAFGMTPSDPAVAGISAADMQTFLDGPFKALMDAPAWQANWSTASDQNITSRISTSEVIETSVNANTQAIRDLVSAYVMVADLGAEQLNDGALQAVIDAAVRTTGGAIGELTTLRAKLGIAEERVATASQRMTIQMDVLAKHVDALEAVDPYEASLRVTSLLTQIETAYALTARLQQMSLINHL